ncbi:MAG: family transporter [Ilumatobacteraceae bacterium]|nr:family transporter [Ilumatobacteraceae bacterium]
MASAVAYSLFAVFTKRALGEGLRPTDLLVWRFGIAVPVVWAIVLVRMRGGGPRPRQAPVPHMFVLGLLFGVVAWLAFGALDHLPAAPYTVIIYTYPAMVAAAASVLGQPSPRRLWAALTLTLAGIALTTVPVALASSDGIELLGVVLTVLNAVAYGAYVLISGRLLAHDSTPTGALRHDGLVAAAWSLTGSLTFAVVVGAIHGVHAPPSAGAGLGLVGLAVISTVIAGIAMLNGIGSLGPAATATIATLEPVLTLVWAVVILDESLRPVQIGGALLVIAGVTWAQRLATRGAEPSTEPALPTPSLA